MAFTFLRHHHTEKQTDAPVHKRITFSSVSAQFRFMTKKENAPEDVLFPKKKGGLYMVNYQHFE